MSGDTIWSMNTSSDSKNQFSTIVRIPVRCMIRILTAGLTRPCVKPGFLDDRCIIVERRTHPENTERCSQTCSRGNTRNLQEEGGRDDDITIRQGAFSRAGLEPSAHVPARRENGPPSVGCCCVRAPGTARRTARAARPAASRAPVR